MIFLPHIFHLNAFIKYKVFVKIISKIIIHETNKYNYIRPLIDVLFKRVLIII